MLIAVHALATNKRKSVCVKRLRGMAGPMQHVEEIRDGITFCTSSLLATVRMPERRGSEVHTNRPSYLGLQHHTNLSHTT